MSQTLIPCPGQRCGVENHVAGEYPAERCKSLGSTSAGRTPRTVAPPLGSKPPFAATHVRSDSHVGTGPAPGVAMRRVGPGRARGTDHFITEDGANYLVPTDGGATELSHYGTQLDTDQLVVHAINNYYSHGKLTEAQAIAVADLAQHRQIHRAYPDAEAMGKALKYNTRRDPNLRDVDGNPQPSQAEIIWAEVSDKSRRCDKLLNYYKDVTLVAVALVQGDQFDEEVWMNEVDMVDQGY